ncbi:formylglycine-generating enzyme family protein [Nocardia rhamnosiphila]|uniref:SUMF1/EgtB/PvdO family nonheme iron enzyme n=1 Tax=Nocardia rhamnosiphila TaxID=426716 RepID=A0ABV2WXU1_9NOCA
MAHHTSVNLRAAIVACPSLRHLPGTNIDVAAATELAANLQSGFDAAVTMLSSRHLTSPKATLNAVVRALEGPADILMLAMASHVVRFARRNNDIWSFALPASLPGRPSSMVRFGDLMFRLAEACGNRPLLLCLDADLAPTGNISATGIVAELMSKWPPHIDTKPAILAATRPTTVGGAAHAIERMCADIASGGTSASVDKLAADAAYFLTSLGIDVCTSQSGECTEISPRRGIGVLPAYIREDLFAADSGCRLDAAAELAHLAAGGNQLASQELMRLASRDREHKVRAYAHTLMHRTIQPNAATFAERRLVPSAVQREAITGRFIPELLPHPGGRIPIGLDFPHGEPGDRPRHFIELPPFRLSRTPVTDRQYLSFVLDDNGPIPDHWETDTSIWKDNVDRPVVMVSYHDALRYCAWLTDRLHNTGQLNADDVITLPSEVEWEAAASNGQGEHYPWGDQADPACCNIRVTAVNQPTTVRMYSPQGDSLCGCADLVGNVWEWTRSLWGPSYRKPRFAYPYNPFDGREDSGHFNMRRVVRGGAFYYATDCADSHTRNRMMPARRHPGGGFRVAAIGGRREQRPSKTALGR